MVSQDKECFRYLKSLPSEDFTGRRHLPSEVQGEYNILDFYKRRGTTLRIESKFVNALDLSFGQWERVELVGSFVRVDLTECKVGKLDVSRTDIIKLDLSDSDIGTIIKP